MDTPPARGFARAFDYCRRFPVLVVGLVITAGIDGDASRSVAVIGWTPAAVRDCYCNWADHTGGRSDRNTEDWKKHERCRLDGARASHRADPGTSRSGITITRGNGKLG